MKDVYLENRVLAADAVELVHILYEHAIVQVSKARAALAAGDILARSQAVTKTLAILGELEGSLNHEAGGSISQNLANLYRYMRRRMLEGSVKQQDQALGEVASLLQTLDEGWSAMRHTTAAPVQFPPASSPSPFKTAVAVEEEDESHSWSA